MIFFRLRNPYGWFCVWLNPWETWLPRGKQVCVSVCVKTRCGETRQILLTFLHISAGPPGANPVTNISPSAVEPRDTPTPALPCTRETVPMAFLRSTMMTFLELPSARHVGRFFTVECGNKVTEEVKFWLGGEYNLATARPLLGRCRVPPSIEADRGTLRLLESHMRPWTPSCFNIEGLGFTAMVFWNRTCVLRHLPGILIGAKISKRRRENLRIFAVEEQQGVQGRTHHLFP